jgi:DNA-binding transcriptional LysR family regulator
VRRYPELRLEVDSSQAVASLQRREADIAVRLAKPAGDGLLVRRVAESANAVFASKSLAKAIGTLDKLDEVPWITWDAAHAQMPSARWYASTVGIEPTVRVSTLLAQIAAVESSVGVALLPAMSAAKHSLVRVKLSGALASSIAFPSDDVYLVCHAALRNVPRINAVWGFLLEVLPRFAANSSLSRGRAG